MKYKASFLTLLAFLSLLTLTPPAALAADTQGMGMQPLTLVSAAPLTNGSTTTYTVSTNFPTTKEWKGDVQLMVLLAPPTGATAPTNGNYCTNLVLQFDYLIGTNVTTDHPFTWNLTSGQLGTYAQTAFTNTYVLWTNLVNCAGRTGIRLSSATPNSTNGYGAALTVMVQTTR